MKKISTVQAYGNEILKELSLEPEPERGRNAEGRGTRLNTFSPSGLFRGIIGGVFLVLAEDGLISESRRKRR